jgi:ABC-2 type transport system permease protein
MACALLSVASINLVYWNGQVIFYPLRSGLAIFTFSLLIAGLATGLGVLISLRASTVRQAQQTFSIAFFLLFIPFFALPLLPEGLRTQAVQFIMQVDLELIVITAGAALFLLDAGLIAAAIRRFQRNRLILD